MTKQSYSWFNVSKKGLKKILEEKGVEFIVYELIQNALDEDTKHVVVNVEWADGLAVVRVTDDNPDGFKDLRHAWTLFAESPKKHDPTKRGRYDLGEKLVLAMCEEATITSTKGKVIFNKDGRSRTATCTDSGTVFEGRIKMLKRDADRLVEAALSIIAPPDVVVEINGEEVPPIERLERFEVKALQTVIADEEGRLKRTTRNTHIDIHKPRPDEEPFLHEMGIPVCPLDEGFQWHIDVQQRVPLNLDRNNVPASFLKKVQVVVLNEMHDRLETSDDANAGWVREAAKAEDATDTAVTKVLDLRFGEKRVGYDPTDKEANSKAVASGYTLVYPSQLSKEEWNNAKRAGAILPAGKVTPSNKVLVGGGDRDLYSQDKWTPAMWRIVQFSERVAAALLSFEIQVQIANCFEERHAAWYGGRTLTFNVACLGKRWFEENDDPQSSTLLRLLLHELSHEFEEDHLSKEFAEAGFRLGAKLAIMAANSTDLLNRERYKALTGTLQED